MNVNTNLSYQYMVYQETHGITGIVHQHIKEIMDKITCNTDESHVSHHPGLLTKSMDARIIICNTINGILHFYP